MKVIIVLLFAVTGCVSSQPKANIEYSTGSYNAWFLETDRKTQETTPIFCMANVKEGQGTAAPTCFKPKRIDPDN